MAFVTAYNFAKHLKALKWRTPYQFICEAWTKDPSIFNVDRAASIRDDTTRKNSLDHQRRECLFRH
jgi:hypothetical protein